MIRLQGARVIQPTSLKLKYEISLQLKTYKDILLIDPNCTRGNMLGLSCVFLTRPLPYSAAEAECEKDGFQLWSSDNPNITLEIDQIFNGTNRYWILNAGEL